MTEHLIDRPARYQPCPRCARHTLIAWTGGIKTRTDPESLNIHAEIAALLTRRLTFDVYVYGLPRRMHLEWRDIDRIRARRKYPVVASHQCMPLPVPPGIAPETDLAIPAPRKQESDVIPF